MVTGIPGWVGSRVNVTDPVPSLVQMFTGISYKSQTTGLVTLIEVSVEQSPTHAVNILRYGHCINELAF